MRLLAILTLVSLLTTTAAQAADDIGIRSMAIDQRILELVENRQLTFGTDGEVECASISPDGKQVAFIAKTKETTNLCLVKSTGGRIATLLSCPTNLPVIAPVATPDGDVVDSGPAIDPGTWLLNDSCGVTWSPDGRRMAVAAGRYDVAPGKLSFVTCILVFTANGAQRTSFPVPQSYLIMDHPIFSPDSQRLAVVAREVMVIDGDIGPDAELPEPKTALIVCDIAKGSSHTVYSIAGGDMVIIGWTRSGRAVITRALEITRDAAGGKLSHVWKHKQIELDGTVSSESDAPKYAVRAVSRDGQYALTEENPNLKLEDLATHVSTPVTTTGECAFVGWAPLSGTLVYSHKEPLSDALKQTTGTINTLWLARLNDTKVSAMCLALDSEASIGELEEPVSWSADSTRMTYTCRERLFVAELAWHEPTAQEKLAAGMALTEEDEKALTLSSGKQIGVAWAMYAADHDDALPSPDNVEDDLHHYLKSSSAFNRPGADSPIFTYLPPESTTSAMLHTPAEIIIGELDPGCYSWKVVIYADSHVKVVPR